MKKLLVGQVVQYVFSTCDWCGEEGVTFESTQDRTKLIKDNKKWKYEYISDGLLSPGRLLKVIDDDYLSSQEVTLPKSHICKNCCKQLAKENI